ncbi:RS5 protein, partial [Atractosteus spatula]|nr:RS5 protein [Atractosteus spatula]
MAEWEAAPAVAETPEIKLFGKWSTDDVQINDISLQVFLVRPGPARTSSWPLSLSPLLKIVVFNPGPGVEKLFLKKEGVLMKDSHCVERVSHLISCLNCPCSAFDYIAVKEKYAKYLPHSGGRYAAKRFRKAQCPIVERLTNSMMMHGRNNGKKLMTVRIVKHAFEIIHLLTGENPLQVLVNAIINSGPREDSTRIGRAGTVRRQAVDVSPLRRVNQAIWLLCTGAREAAFRNIKTIAECLADELINAAKVRQELG